MKIAPEAHLQPTMKQRPGPEKPGLRRARKKTPPPPSPVTRHVRRVDGPLVRPSSGLRPLDRHVPEVSPGQLRWTCDFNRYRLDPVHRPRIDVGTVGQDRAMEALKLGTRIPGPGYNVFVCGHPGTGRTSAVKAVLRDARPAWATLRDYCYVHNFKDSDRPEVLELRTGQGRLLKDLMEKLVTRLRREIPAIFERPDHAEQRARLLDRFHKGEHRVMALLDRRVRRQGFVVGQYPEGGMTRQDLFAMIEGRAVNLSQVNDLVAAGQIPIEVANHVYEQYMRLQPELVQALKKRQNQYRKAVNTLLEAEKKATRPLIDRLVDQIRNRISNPRVHRYLDRVARSLVDELHLFKEPDDEMEEGGAAAEHEGPAEQKSSPDDIYLKYRVNVLLDNSETREHQVILEPSPSYSKLFGSIERVERGGVWYGDFMGIKGGSLLRADGGYLILNCTDVLSEPHVWVTLKRVLKHRQLEIQTPETVFQHAPVTLKPEPIHVHVKVVLIGLPDTYELLCQLDEDFEKIFKVKAEFDSEMSLNSSNLDHFIQVINKIVREEELLKPNRAALAMLAEYAVRRSGRQGKLTTHFSDIANVLREAHYWATGTASRLLQKSHIARAIEERTARMNLTETKLQELIESGILLIDTAGSRVGQVNGLWVYETGSYSFGLPARITATTTPGRQGVINIEREVQLSGAVHDKGVLIMAGYLRYRYARNVPLSLAASICFEQSYSGVDGDSAAMAELLALVSDLSAVPLRQDVAITGSVNQKGGTQAVGGVNEKIEGFFRVCESRGLTGHQGVIIPASNVEDLMLHHDVVTAVKRRRFHVFPVHHVDEALEILSGMKAGDPQPDGAFPPETINARAQQRLQELATLMTQYRG